MSAPDLQSLFFIEQDIETEFKRLLAQVTANTYRSREGVDMSTPWLEVTFNVGKVTRRKQRQAIVGSTVNLYYDSCWEESSLELKVCTNRRVNAADHKLIIGRARSLVTLPSLCGYANESTKWAQAYHAITDIREVGTVHECDTENDLDFSTVTFSVVHNIKEDAWP